LGCDRLLRPDPDGTGARPAGAAGRLWSAWSPSAAVGREAVCS